MTSDVVNAQLPEPLARHVERVVGPGGLYETPDEYVRSLIRRDMENDSFQVYRGILEGFQDIVEGRYFESGGNWEKDKEIFEQKEAEGWK
uniref:Addiction module antidote protein, CC2985 family n=1 Tax=Candidatus Kentrum sp. FW TaxID=2126338 RepID=A0A450TS04_9GAMM|nr:MAG: hypothetical protein BECKFW1821C_GA0114237_102554 [Candidatus Kentron sp. FW]